MRESYDIINASFYMSYVLLVTTSVITVVEALRTPEVKIRNMMNLETCISVIASFFYGVFVAMVGDLEKPIDYKKITHLRYMDWSITTPLMLLVLLTALVFNTDKQASIGIFAYLFVFAANYGMLGFGYLGETQMMERTTANILGFVCFAIMFGFIFIRYVKPKYHFGSYALFFSYIAIWGMYGIVYFFDDVTKNICYNGLDVIAKAIVGILLWAFYNKVFRVEKVF